MIKFNELGITSDKQNVIVDCSVESLSIYSGMHIASVVISYEDKNYTLYTPGDGEPFKRNVRCTLNIASVKDAWGIPSFKGKLLFVTVECDGTIDPSVVTLSCDWDTEVDKAAIPDWEVIYSQGMRNVHNELCNKCSASMTMLDFITLWESFKLANTTCDWDMVKKLWKYFVSGSNDSSSTCGCN